MINEQKKIEITDYETHIYAYSALLSWGRKFYGGVKNVTFEELKQCYDEHLEWKKSFSEFKDLVNNHK